MNKRDLIKATCEKLKSDGVKKIIATPKRTFYISDDDGNTCKFHVKQRDKRISFSCPDITAIIDAAMSVVEDAVKAGEEVNLNGFGALTLNKRAERRTKIPGTSEWVTIDSHYVPKFTSGKRLRMAAKLYELEKAGDE